VATGKSGFARKKRRRDEMRLTLGQGRLVRCAPTNTYLEALVWH
jgi:hypothetical protein